MKAIVSAALAGLLFAVGLGIGGMTDPQKVVGFLNVAGKWDPSLMFVMAGALAVHIPLRLLLMKREQPLFAPSFPSFANAGISRRLLVGSAVFGIGWGLGGYCPGPGLVSMSTGGTSAIAFGLAMLGGMGVFQLWSRLDALKAAQVAAEVAADDGVREQTV